MQRSAFVWTISMMLAATPAVAGQHGRGGGPSPKPTPSAHPAPQPTHVSKPAPVPHAQSGAKVHGGTAPKTHTTTTHGSAAAHTTTNTKPASTAKAGTGTTTTGSTPTGSTPGTLTAVQQKLQKNTHLADKLQGRLPAGTDLMTAASGFRNLGQFVAAVNVSNNLGIKFTDLKTRMVDEDMSLGQAIQDARPTADSPTAVRRAEADADALIRSTDQATAAATTTATKTKNKTSGRKPHGSDR